MDPFSQVPKKIIIVNIFFNDCISPGCICSCLLALSPKIVQFGYFQFFTLINNATMYS